MSGPERNDDMRAIVREVLQEVTNGNGKGRRSTTAEDAAVVPQVPAPPVAAVLRPSTWDRPPVPGEVIGNAAAPPSSAPAPASVPAPASAPAPSSAPAPEPSPRRQSLHAAFKDAEFRPSAPAPSPSPPPEIQSSAPTAGQARVEVVTLDGDEDLERFIRELMIRLENPRERLAIRTGRLRFKLRRAAGAPAAAANGSAAAATRVEKGAVTERMIRAAAAEGTRLVLAPGAVLTPLAREQARARGVEIERERRC